MLVGRPQIGKTGAVFHLVYLLWAHIHAWATRPACLRTLVELGTRASLSAADANGRTPAHGASSHGHVTCLRALAELGAGASLSAADAQGATPAHLAAKSGHEACLWTLVELGADVSL